MPDWSITLSDLDYGPEEAAAIQRVLRNKWLSMGPETRAFEEEFAAFIGAKHAIAVANGTAGLHLAYLALGLGPGDEVIQPAVSFVAAANMTKAVGAVPVFAGICGLDEPTVDPAKIESLITPRTKAVVVMHYGGYCCRMAEILSLCQRHGLALIEDACHAVGARYPLPSDLLSSSPVVSSPVVSGPVVSSPVVSGPVVSGPVVSGPVVSSPLVSSPVLTAAGNLGDIGCFSFFSNKNMVTGEGGMVTTNSDDIARKIRSLRSHGMTSLSWDRHRGHAASYDVLAHGYNYRLDDLRSALGREQLKKLPRNNQRRREFTALYWRLLEPLESLGWTLPFKRMVSEDGRSKMEDSVSNSALPSPISHLLSTSAHIMTAVAPDADTRSRCAQRLADARIQTSLHYPLIVGLSAFADSPHSVTDQGIEFCRRVITLPLYPTMTEAQVERVCAELAAGAGVSAPSLSRVEIPKPSPAAPSILITGARSFSGRHLADYLGSLDFGTVVGSDLPADDGLVPGGNFEPCDIRDGAAVRKLIDSVRPETVYHLVGAADESDPAALIRTNIEGTWHVLDACRRLSQPPRILLIGSAAGYGRQSLEAGAIREDAPAWPNTFYGFSREAELALGQLAHNRWRLPVFLCRPFNLIGPGLNERYAPAAILRRLLSAGNREPGGFPLRNANAIRDFVDVRDAVRAYHLILKQGRPGVIYNIGSGKGVRLGEFAGRLARLAGRSISVTDDTTSADLDRSDVEHSIANCDRLASDTGWRPEIPLDQSLADMILHMRESANTQTQKAAS